MKKLTVLMAILFASAMVFAQDPYSNGAGNNAFIEQAAEFGASINISQIGDYNLIEGPATLDDAGSNNSHAAAYQYNGGSNHTFFNYDQEGFGNYGWVKQRGMNYNAEFDWTQDGDGNYMKMDQKGGVQAKTEASYQIGDGNIFAGLDNINSGSSSIALSDITDPNGMETAAYQYSTNSSGSIWVKQDGMSNKAALWQRNTGDGTWFDLTQDGDYNEFAGYQYNVGAPGKNKMEVEQIGNSYDAVCFQKNLFGGGNNYASYQH